MLINWLVLKLILLLKEKLTFDLKSKEPKTKLQKKEKEN